jgi:hypothetical protein
MRSIKNLMIFPLCLFATLGNGGTIDQKEKFQNSINFLSKLIAYKYQLSTTGYQAAMIKGTTKLTPERAQQYINKAKATFPKETLKNMALLQSTYINKIPETGQLSDPHHMNGEQLTSCLHRCREKNFANCEMQSLEIAIHLYALGFKKFKIWSNKAISHNYVVIDPTTFFPRGAIVDSHLGYGFRELDMKMITTYKHFEKNIMVVQNMMDWLDKNATTYANKLWLSVILEKFYPREGPTPLASIR